MTPMEKVDLLRAACCVAGIDGKVEEPERAVIERLASEVGVGQASMNAMIDRGVRDPDFYKMQFRILKADPEKSMSVLLEVALADGKITDAETHVLRGLSEKLNVPGEVFDKLMISLKGNG